MDIDHGRLMSERRESRDSEKNQDREFFDRWSRSLEGESVDEKRRRNELTEKDNFLEIFSNERMSFHQLSQLKMDKDKSIMIRSSPTCSNRTIIADATGN